VHISRENPFSVSIFESERLNVKNNTTSAIPPVFCALHDQLASLTRCFSAVAEFLVLYPLVIRGQLAILHMWTWLGNHSQFHTFVLVVYS